MFKRLVLFCALLMASAAAGQTIRFNAVPEAKVWSRLEQFSGTNADREQRLKTWFAEAGCTPTEISEETVPHSKVPNVLCTIPGETKRTIIVGAHFDYVKAGSGVVDNWSGASLLPSLIEVVRQSPRKHTFVFVGFSEEEVGLIGSAAYLKQVPKADRPLIDAMINFDTVGLAHPEVWVSHADKTLVGAMSVVAKAMNIPVTGVNVDGIGSSDSEPFFEKKIPAMTIHSVTQENLKILHTSKDTLAAMNRQDYDETYRLACGYLVFIDQALPVTPQNASNNSGKAVASATDAGATASK